MTWGKGGARLGHGGGKVLKPTVVPGMEYCVKLACSSTQTAVLTADRKLNVFDDNLGKVHFSASHCGDIVEIYSGNGLTAIRNTNGVVYFVGSFMKQTYSLESPIAEEISSVSFGAEHCLLLSKDGTIKSFGANGSGQLGLGDKTERSAAEVIKGLANVRSIVAGERHSAAVTHEGALYVWGASPHGREDMLTPVKHFTSENIEKLEMSKENLIALSSNVSIYSPIARNLDNSNDFSGTSVKLATRLLRQQKLL
jgi:alpha-tubulin suppressor-like RCC1 family protein